MTEDEALNARLTAFFAEPEPAPDEAFVARVQRAVLAEKKIAEMRRAQWRRFAVEALASAAIAAVFWLLGRVGPLNVELGEGLTSPATTAALILGLWFVVELRPAAWER